MGPDEPPATDADLEYLLRQRRYGPPDPDEVTPWSFTRRWSDADLRNRVWPLVSRMLMDDDVLVRARCVEYVRGWDEGRDVAMPRLLDVAEQHPELFGDQDEWGVTLRSSLGFALSASREVDRPRAAAILREISKHEATAGATTLARVFPDAIVDGALRWGDAKAQWISEGVNSIAFHRPQDLLRVLEQLIGLGADTRKSILDSALEYLPRADPKLAPTAEQCRTAIGL